MFLVRTLFSLQPLGQLEGCRTREGRMSKTHCQTALHDGCSASMTGLEMLGVWGGESRKTVATRDDLHEKMRTDRKQRILSRTFSDELRSNLL